MQWKSNCARSPLGNINYRQQVWTSKQASITLPSMSITQYVKERKNARKKFRKSNPDWRLRKASKAVDTYNKLPLHVSPVSLKINTSELSKIQTPWKAFTHPIIPFDLTEQQQKKSKSSKKQKKNNDKHHNNHNNNYSCSDKEGENSDNDFIVHFE
jgi:hypothetical protein